MKYIIRALQENDYQSVTDIFNYFVRESFAAYTEEEKEPDFVHKLSQDATEIFVIEYGNDVVGFGYLKPYLSYSNFNHSTALTYFILPQHTGKGLGTRILNVLIETAEKHGITHLLAHISSKNPQSLRFHQKHGFKECGRLTGIGVKFGEPFDVVWMQRIMH